MDILAPLAPHADKLLYGVGLLLVIALLGGTRLHVKDLEVGPLGPAARGLAATFGILLFVAFLLTAQAPEPPPTFPVRGKIIVGIFPELAGQVETVSIAPSKDGPSRIFRPLPVRSTHVEPDGGNFDFPAADAIKEGRYEFVVNFRKGNQVSTPIVIEKNVLLLIVHDDSGTRQISVDPVTYFKERYTGYWAKKVQAIEHLGDLVKRYPEKYRKRLVDAYNHERSDLKELAIWALGDACATEVKVELEAIYSGAVDATEYDKLRAGFQLTCFPDHSQIVDDLFERLQKPVSSDTSDQDKIFRRLAAFYLLKRDRFEGCVVRELILGASFEKKDAEDMIYIMLANKLKWRDEYLSEDTNPLDWERDEWRSWFSQHESDLRSCPISG